MVIIGCKKISRKKYSLVKQLEINHTAGSVLPNDRECLRLLFQSIIANADREAFLY